MNPQPIVDEILSLGPEMIATGEGPTGIGVIAADAGINWDAALRELRGLITENETNDRCSTLLAGAVAGIRLAHRQAT